MGEFAFINGRGGAPMSKPSSLMPHLSAVLARDAQTAVVSNDVLQETYWWGTRDIVDYPVIRIAATAYLRTCAQLQGRTLSQFFNEMEAALAAQRGGAPAG
jgi:hypothetical protein